MAKEPKKLTKTPGGIPAGSCGIARGIAAGLLYRCTAAVCWLLPLAPAVLINLASVGSQGITMAAVAIGAVVFCALCVEEALESGSAAVKALCGVLAAFVLCANLYTAMTNVATHSEHSRGEKTRLMRDSTRDTELSRRLSASREAQVKVAGDATQESIDAEIRAAKAKDAKRWSSTDHCNPDKITAGASATFCSELGNLDVKKAAAVKRDDIDTQLAALAAKDTGAVPESADPAAENMARLLGSLGVSVTETGKSLIAALSDWRWAILAELMAAFGPWLLLSKLRRASTRRDAPKSPHKEPVRAKGTIQAPAPQTETAPQQAATAVLDGDAAIDDFIARRVEFIAGDEIQAGDLFRAWKHDCEERGADAGSAKGFSNRIRKRIPHSPNNGHPVYSGVCLKAVRPHLHVVAN